MPNGHKIYQSLPLKDRPKFTQIGIFGSKVYHLATLREGLGIVKCFSSLIASKHSIIVGKQSRNKTVKY
jgi:hypothetical protein